MSFGIKNFINKMKKGKLKFTYLITGHKGLIGKELVKRLNNSGGECICSFDKREGTNCLNICNYKPKKKIDVVFHLAANCKINQCIKNPLLANENSKMNELVMEFCRINKIKHIVYFSSSRVLNSEKNPYVASKLYGEELCKSYKACYKINYTIIRPSTVYGKRDETKRLIQIWIDNAKKNKNLEIYGEKDKTLDFTYIEDFLDAVMFIFKNKILNGEFNISGRKEIKLTTVANEIIKQTNSKSKIIFKKLEIQQPQKVKIKNTLTLNQYKPKFSIKEGIKEIIAGDNF